MSPTLVLQTIGAAPASFARPFQETSAGNGLGWLWVLLIIVLVVLIAWWGYRSSQAANRVDPTRSIMQEAAPVKSDDLVIIEGIGPKIAEVLKMAGITTFAQLAQTSPARLDEILKAANLRLADPSSWPEQARLAAAGDMEGLNALQGRLKGGRSAVV